MQAAGERHETVSAELEKYRRVFQAMPDYASFSYLHTGVIIDVNPGFQHMTGYRRDEVIGVPSSSIRLWVHPEHRARVVQRLQVEDSMWMETQFRHRYGEIVDVEISFSVLRIDGDDLLVAVARDVTARKRQEEELARYRTRLEQLVEQRTVELEDAMKKLQDLASHDELTGVGNRRDLNFHLQLEFESVKRFGVPSSVAVFDIDVFKQINDRYGHAAGDAVIKAFAEVVKREMRAVDYVARYGGDEFVLLLKGIGADAALIPLRRIREAVLAHDWNAIVPDMRVTTSIGVATFHAGESADDAFRRADKALYNAKVQGRNRIVAADDGAQAPD